MNLAATELVSGWGHGLLLMAVTVLVVGGGCVGGLSALFHVIRPTDRRNRRTLPAGQALESHS